MIYKSLLPILLVFFVTYSCAQSNNDDNAAKQFPSKESTYEPTEADVLEEPTRWRGPNANGIYPDTGLLNVWAENGPEELWHFEGLGVGHSSPKIANGKIYVTGMTGKNTGTLFVLSTDGELLKQTNYGTEWSDNYSGTRSSPTVVGNLVYVYSAMGDFVCLNSESLDVVWRKNVFRDFDGENIKWGVTETPVVEGDKVYISPGGKKNNIIALNRFTGELIWSSAAQGEISAYCTPKLIDLPERKILVTMMDSHIIGVDRENGEFLWAHHHPNRYSVHANTPLYEDGKILFSSGYRKGTGALNISDDGAKISEAWFSEDLDCRMGGMVIIDGYLYASGQNRRGWQAIDIETGEQQFYDTSIGHGVIIAADDKFFLYTQRGEIALANVNPKEFDLVSTGTVEYGTGQHWAHPVIDDGVIYVRHGEALVAYKIK